MASSHVDCILPAVCQGCGESPVWDARQGGRLTFVDAFHSSVHCWTEQPAEGQAKHSVLKVPDDRTISFFIPRRSTFSKGVAGLGKTLIELDWNAEGQYKILCDSLEDQQPTNFNDAKCDSQGRLVAGVRSLWKKETNEPQLFEGGSLVGFQDDMSRAEILLPKGFSLSNGLAWTKDGRTLFFVDSSPARCVYILDYEPNSNFAVSKRSAPIDFALLGLAGSPDGLAMDANDRLWVACHGASCVVCLDLNNGAAKIVDKIIFPTRGITSCCFGGENLATLFVTSERGGGIDDNLAGSVFRVTNIGTVGQPVSLCK